MLNYFLKNQFTERCPLTCTELRQAIALLERMINWESKWSDDFSKLREEYGIKSVYKPVTIGGQSYRQVSVISTNGSSMSEFDSKAKVLADKAEKEHKQDMTQFYILLRDKSEMWWS